jgi:hypothetical protein
MKHIPREKTTVTVALSCKYCRETERVVKKGEELYRRCLH